MNINAPFLQKLDGKSIVMMPENFKFPFNKIKVDFIFCSHKTWNQNKEDIIRKTINKPKIIFMD